MKTGSIVSARGCFALLVTSLVAGSTEGQLTFTEIGASHGISAYSMAPVMGGGVAAADYDDDGDVDLFVPNAENVPDQLYRNQGDGSFEEIAASVGLASTWRSRSALWLDYDGDGDLDLAVAGDCFGSQWSPEPGNETCEAGSAVMRLYRQEPNGSFADVSLPSGLYQDSGSFRVTQHRGAMAAGDLSGDGYPELYVSWWNGPSHLFWNNGNGTFTDVQATSGIGNAARKDWQPVFHDWNGDGRLDIFVSVDFGPNKLFINQGDGTFVDQAPAAGVASSWNEMGVAVGDYDNDGDFDLYVTNIWNYTPGEQNVLFRNDSAGGVLDFTEVAVAAGVADTDWGWGATFLDADKNGVLDLAVTNGFSEGYENDPSRFFLGQGGPDWDFLDVSDTVGFNDTFWGSSLIALDCDRDGDLDLVQTSKVHPAPGPLRLLDNSGVSGRHYLNVRPRMPAPNSQAIGAVVRVRTGTLTQSRLITAGISFMGQEPAEAFFGLGTATAVDEIVVEWPDGSRTRRGKSPVDRIATVSWNELFADGFESGDFSPWSSVVP